jgi:hypothetical protein
MGFTIHTVLPGIPGAIDLPYQSWKVPHPPGKFYFSTLRPGPVFPSLVFFLGFFSSPPGSPTFLSFISYFHQQFNPTTPGFFCQLLEWVFNIFIQSRYNEQSHQRPLISCFSKSGGPKTISISPVKRVREDFFASIISIDNLEKDMAKIQLAVYWQTGKIVTMCLRLQMMQGNIFGTEVPEQQRVVIQENALQDASMTLEEWVRMNSHRPPKFMLQIYSNESTGHVPPGLFNGISIESKDGEAA